MSHTDIAERLRAPLVRDLGTSGAIESLRRLSGGANMESWSFDCDGQGFVLRRAPSEAFMQGRSYSHDVEARLIRAARAAGVRAPEVVAELQPEDGLGTGFVMRRVEAEVNPATILAAPAPSLLADLARELAGIHRVPLDAVDGVPRSDAATMLAQLQLQFEEFGADRPILALALHWLHAHLPEPCEPTLVHGDFRMGNVMADGEGLAAVLDWELSHIGDPHEDLAFGCMTVWRFGHIDKPAYGLGQFEEYFAAYEAASGRSVDRQRFHYWLVLRTLWWALGCIRMGTRWRSGADRSLERVVIGRRTAENELDLLTLLEDEAPEVERELQLPPAAPDKASPQGEPSAAEIVTAVAEWLEAEIKPRMSGHDKFQTVVALNALGMVRRELARPAVVEDHALAQDLLSGKATLATPGLLAHLRRTVLDKLSNDVPKYAALKRAQARWPGAMCPTQALLGQMGKALH
ncbi:phosphotransferase family protein [Comamonas serinivorans]|uniref:Phosphotransferase family protein n=1 Tax=Comamonas serinivorans TaxID=1082851 RepID=A0A1Y0ETM0_9BURK|nr:phosphotransferase family protein [Comamonas serinivorans]